MKICFFGTYNATYSRNSSLRDGLKKNGVELIEVHREIPNIVLERPSDLTLTKSLYRILRKLHAYLFLLSKYRLVLACDYIFVLHPGHLDLPLAYLLAKIGGKKLYFDDSISPYDTMFVGRAIALRNSLVARFIKFTEKLLLKLPDRILVDTEEMKKFLAHEIGVEEEKVFTVPLGANNIIYHPDAVHHSVSANGKTRIFFFGLYNPMHGADQIMKAVKLLNGDRNINFVMLGKGYLKQELENYAAENKLTNVVFTGFVPEDELVREINRSEIVLGVFSNSKLFERVIPNKIFAALACRKPLITARLKVLEQFLKHGENAYFVEPENPAEIADAVKLLSRNPSLRKRLAENGYRLYREKFTPQVIGRTVLANL